MKSRGLKLGAVLGNSTVFLFAAILVGSFLGTTSPAVVSFSNNYIDPTILVLVFLLLFEVPVKGIFSGYTNLKFIGIAWVTNFIVIPTVGFAVASLFLSGSPLFYTGLIIYFMAPCTDWYLGFTRLAKGNVELGAALLPINMVTQLALYPVYLAIFNTSVNYQIDLSMLIQWFLQPLGAAIILRLVLHKAMDKISPFIKIAVPVVLTLLVAQIFAANISELLSHLSVVPWLLAAIFTFFVLTYLIVENIAKVAKFNYPEKCSLSFTTAARNAPLMLGLTTIAMPDQPLIYGAITIGMLIEFPHLTALKTIMLNRLNRTLASH